MAACKPAEEDEKSDILLFEKVSTDSTFATTSFSINVPLFLSLLSCGNDCGNTCSLGLNNYGNAVSPKRGFNCIHMVPCQNGRFSILSSASFDTYTASSNATALGQWVQQRNGPVGSLVVLLVMDEATNNMYSSTYEDMKKHLGAANCSRLGYRQGYLLVTGVCYILFRFSLIHERDFSLCPIFNVSRAVQEVGWPSGSD
jgi:hypothetical protein